MVSWQIAALFGVVIYFLTVIAASLRQLTTITRAAAIRPTQASMDDLYRNLVRIQQDVRMLRIHVAGLDPVEQMKEDELAIELAAKRIADRP